MRSEVSGAFSSAIGLLRFRVAHRVGLNPVSPVGPAGQILYFAAFAAEWTPGGVHRPLPAPHTPTLILSDGHEFYSILTEGLRPSDSPARSLARRCAGALPPLKLRWTSRSRLPTVAAVVINAVKVGGSLAMPGLEIASTMSASMKRRMLSDPQRLSMYLRTVAWIWRRNN